MPASALLKFVQGATVGGDGRALVGVLTTSVALSNVNNASVASWQIDLVYVDPTSGLSIATPYAFNDASSVPAAAFAPDVRRSFRWQLKVWSVPNRVGQPDDIDIRVFSVRELNGALIPPSQVWPPPLPDPRSGELNAKPNEMNYAGQLEGWHGTGSDGLLNELLAKHMPPLPGNPGDVLTVSSGRWVSAAPSGGGGSGDVVGPGVSVTGNMAVYADTTGKLLADGGIAPSAFIRHNGSVAFTGNQSMGGFKLTTVANGVAAGDAVNLGQLQAAIAGLDPKGNVRAYTTTNIAALTGLGAITGSGVASFTDGQRVGLGGQSTATQNGIWVVHSGAWTRPTDFTTGMDVSGAYFTVEEGTFADRAFLVQNDEGSAVVGTNNLVLIDFGTSSIAAGNGLQKIGNTISVLHDGGTLSSSGSGLKVAAGGITTTEIATSAVNLTTQVTGLLPFANIANGSAASLFGRSANSTGVQASIASSADGQLLRRSGGVLAFGAADLADTDAVTGLLPFANIANGSALSVFGRGANTSGVMASIAGTADQVLAVNTAGTTLAFGQVQTGGIATSAVTLAKIADATASSVLGRSAATTGAYADITSSADGQVLRRGAAGVIAFGAVDLADTDAVTGLLPFANIANGSANSVFGRAAGTSGVQASIAASADGQVMRMAAGSLAFGAVDLADADAVTGLLPYANMASLAGLSVLGRGANSTGVMAAITGTANQVLVVNSGGTALAFGTIGTSSLTVNSVDMTILADLAGLSVIGRSANTTGDPAAITATATGQVLRYAGTTLAFGALDLADADAVTNQLPGSFVVPNFVAQNVVTTGTYSAGTNPATGGAYNLANATDIQGRNAANSANQVMLRIDSSNTVSVGDVAATGMRMTTAGVIGLRIGGADAVVVQATNFEWALATVQFDVAVTNPSLIQEADSTTAVTADSLTIQAQSATGTGATVGGILNLRGGDSTNGTGGGLDLRSGAGSTATVAGLFTLRIGATIFFSYPGTVVPAQSGILRAHHNASVIVGRNNANSADVSIIRWGTTTDTLIVGAQTAGFNTNLLGDVISISGVGNTIVSVNGSQVLTVASALVTSAQPVAIGATTAAAGALRLANAAEIRARNAANSADIILVSSSASDQAVYGDTTTGQIVLSAQNVLLRPAGTDRVQVTDTVFEWRMATVRFDVAVVSPVIQQEVDATNAVTGDTLTIAAQDVTGTGATVGGALSMRGGNSTNGTGGGTDIRSGTGLTSILAGGFTLRIGSTIFLSWSGTAPVATTGALRYANSTGAYFRNNANNADRQIYLTTASDGISFGDTGVGSITLTTANLALILGTQIEIQGASQLRFDTAVVSPNIIHEADSTAAVTGDTFLIQAQQVTGTGATVGGLMSVRGGDSTNGTGGGLDLRSGVGSTAILAGAVTINIGNTIIFSYPGTVIPATTGILRAHHNSIILSGRDSGNTTNAGLVRWGTNTTDKLTLGNSVYAAELIGSSVDIGDGSVYLEVAVLATNREIISFLHGAALTTTEMAANTGDKVAFWADATAVPTTGVPVGGTILFSSAVMGFSGKGAGKVEATMVPRGDSTVVTRKFADLVFTDTFVTAATTEVSVVDFDLSSVNFNGAAVSDCLIKVRFECIGVQTAGNFYSHGVEKVALIRRNGGTNTLVNTPENSNSGVGGQFNTGSNPPTVATIKVSGNLVQGRIAPFDGSSTTWFGKLVVMGIEL